MKTSKETQFGVTSMGEKGQVVIPADIRAKLAFAKGEKLIVIAREGCVTLVPASRFEEMSKRFSAVQNLFTRSK
jgi:AbrB family looped-hinge helix DNA binding protein